MSGIGIVCLHGRHAGGIDSNPSIVIESKSLYTGTLDTPERRGKIDKAFSALIAICRPSCAIRL